MALPIRKDFRSQMGKLLFWTMVRFGKYSRPSEEKFYTSRIIITPENHAVIKISFVHLLLMHQESGN